MLSADYENLNVMSLLLICSTHFQNEVEYFEKETCLNKVHGHELGKCDQRL